MSALHVAHICSYFYPHHGGVETYLYNLSKELVKLGVDVSIYTSNDPKTCNCESMEGFEVYRLPVFMKVYTVPIMPTLLPKLLESKADILHVHVPHLLIGSIASLSTLIKERPLIVSIYNLEVFVGARAAKSILANLYNNTLLNFVLSRAEIIFTMTERYAQEVSWLRKYYDKISLSPGGVDIEKFKPNKKAIQKKALGLEKYRVILFVGFMDKSFRYKGVDVLIHAAPIVLRELKDVKFVLVGKGGLIAEYRRLARELGVEDHITFIQEYVQPKHYQVADVLVLPSVSKLQEGFGLVTLEALASGTPVIVSDAAGVSEVITKERIGKVFNAGNSQELAKQILEVLSDMKYASRLACRGRRVVLKKYTWRSIAEGVLRIYEKSLERR